MPSSRWARCSIANHMLSQTAKKTLRRISGDVGHVSRQGTMAYPHGVSRPTSSESLIWEDGGGGGHVEYNQDAIECFGIRTATIESKGQQQAPLFQEIDTNIRVFTRVFRDREACKSHHNRDPKEPTVYLFATHATLSFVVTPQTTETPRTSATRFCTPNLPVIESALGLDAYEGEDEERDEEESTGVGFFMSEGRKSLREACTVVVEDAINAVLLGMRERVGHDSIYLL